MSKMLVTGGCGFIGANLIRGALKRNAAQEIVVVDNETMGTPKDLPEGPITYIPGDIRDTELMTRASQGCDTIVHLAAHTRVVESVEDPLTNFDVNVRGTLSVLLAAREAKVGHVIMASTGGAILGEVEPPVHEGMVPSPAAPYGASKLATEGYGSAFSASYGMCVTALRFSNVYGPMSYRKGSAVAHFFRQILDRRPLEVFGDGSQTRDFVFVSDLCQGILRAADAKVPGVFQLGSGKPTQLVDLIAEMKAIVGKENEPKVEFRPFRAGELRHTYCDITKASRTFGYAPATELKDGLRATWEWFLAWQRETNERAVVAPTNSR
jgi:UDP-glucose 4-epimerase